MMLRKPVCAESWYPLDKKDIEKYFEKNVQKTDSIACICPHAGWMYSGKVAGAVYSRLNNYDTYILLGPNHTGIGPTISIFSEGSWEMPLGKVDIDADIAKNILSISEFAESDFSAHSREHSIEVQLPFLQCVNSQFKIIPILLKTDEYEICVDIANAIASSINKTKKKVLVIATTDMTHYESADYAKKQDKYAIDEILNLHAEELVNIVLQRGITMCGFAPTAVSIVTAIKLGAKSCTLIKYSNSGDITGDNNSVVSYAGFIIR